jgi:hypothetical protein
MRHIDIESPLCPESDVVGDTPNPAGGGPGGGGSGGGGGPGGPGSSNLRAGAAASDITPPIGTPMFAYTARSAIRVGDHFHFDPDDPVGSTIGSAVNSVNGLRQILADPDENSYAKSFEPSDGIHTRVLARALVIERNGEKFALVQADLGGLPYALTQDVARRVAATGITGERLMLSATHTHGSTGPIWPADANGYAALGGDFFDPRIFELTAAGIAEAVIQADKNLEPARVGVGTAEVRSASRNREFDLAFVLRRISSIEIIDAGVDGGTARVRARYPAPAAGALVALPRRVRTGTATLRIRQPGGAVRDVTARPDAAGLAFTAAVPPGSTIESVRVEDGCGNTGP